MYYGGIVLAAGTVGILLAWQPGIQGLRMKKARSILEGAAHLRDAYIHVYLVHGGKRCLRREGLPSREN